MNIEIEKAKKEYDDGNYQQALKHLNNVTSDDNDYEYSLIFKASILFKMEDFKESLKLYDELIPRHPYEVLFWIEKTYCHYRLDENEKALTALNEVDRLLDKNDNKSLLLALSDLYFHLKDYENALKYCDYALNIDGNYESAWYNKLLILYFLDRNDDEMDTVINKIIQLSNGDILSLLPVLLQKLFSKNYRDCVNIINLCEDSKFDSENIEILKGAFYNYISKDLNVKLLLVNSNDLPIDDALNALIDFADEGKDNGKINGVQYFIV